MGDCLCEECLTLVQVYKSIHEAIFWAACIIKVITHVWKLVQYLGNFVKNVNNVKNIIIVCYTVI